MALHKLVTDRPEYRQAVEAKAEKRTLVRRFAEFRGRTETEHQRAVQAHRELVRAALASGEEPPPPPTAPPIDYELGARLVEEQHASHGLERDALRRLAPELMPALERRAAEVEATVRGALEILQDWVGEANDLRDSAQQLATAASLPRLESGRLDVVKLFALVHAGRRLLEPAATSINGQPQLDTAGFDTSAPPGSHGDRLRPTGSRVLDGRR